MENRTVRIKCESSSEWTPDPAFAELMVSQPMLHHLGELIAVTAALKHKHPDLRCCTFDTPSKFSDEMYSQRGLDTEYLRVYPDGDFFIVGRTDPGEEFVSDILTIGKLAEMPAWDGLEEDEDEDEENEDGEPEEMIGL
jgi:hypothetical protein